MQVTESNQRLLLHKIGIMLVWSIDVFLGIFHIYGTYAWVSRAVALANEGYISELFAVSFMGLAATLFPVIVVVGVWKSRSRMSLRCAALYGLCFSMFMMFFLMIVIYTSPLW